MPIESSLPIRTAETIVQQMAGTKNPGAGAAFTPSHQSVPMLARASIVRPANATPYDGGDIEGAASGNHFFRFDLKDYGVARGLLVGARLHRSGILNTGVRRRGMVHVGTLSAAPAADNAAFPLTWSNSATEVGHIDFLSPLTGFGAGSDRTTWLGIPSNTQGIVIDALANDGIFDVHMVTLDPYTPTASITSMLELHLVV